jgi:hypothetical protein
MCQAFHFFHLGGHFGKAESEAAAGRLKTGFGRWLPISQRTSKVLNGVVRAYRCSKQMKKLYCLRSNYRPALGVGESLSKKRGYVGCID